MDLEDYYSVDTIKNRLSNTLNSEEWESLIKTDMGQSLLTFGANIIHYNFMGMLISMDQMFLETADKLSYLEAIAKDFNVVPEPYQASNITMEMIPSFNQILEPFELAVKFDNGVFYNIEEIEFDEGVAKVVKLYEGSIRRRSSSIYTPYGKSWNYETLPTLNERKIGSHVAGTYFLLEENVYLDSIDVFISKEIDSVKIGYERVDNLYTMGKEDRVFLLERDYLHNFMLIFGDGIYGKEYDSSEIMHIRYLMTNGEIDDIQDYSKYDIFVTDIKYNDLFNISNVSKMVKGTSVVSFEDLKMKIKNKISGGKRVVTVDDHISYLESRSDVVAAACIVERDIDLKDIDNCNVVRYLVKPAFEGAVVDKKQIMSHLFSYGLPSVVYKEDEITYIKFDIEVDITYNKGANKSATVALIKKILQERYSWESCGLGEKLVEKYVISLLAQEDITDLDFSNVSVKFKFYLTPATLNIKFGLIRQGDVYQLPLITTPEQLFIKSDSFKELSFYKDGEIWAEYNNGNTIPVASLNNDMFFIGLADFEMANVFYYTKDAETQLESNQAIVLNEVIITEV